MLATPAATLPTAHDYAYEFKWDGMRALAHINDPPGALRLLSRNGNDVTAWFPELAPMAAALKRPVVLDGEIVCMGAGGRPDFGRLQSRLGLLDAGQARRQAKAHPAHFVAFDVLYLGGRSLLDKPYAVRRHQLEALGLDGPSWGTSPSRVNAGAQMLDASRHLGMEGIMAKRLTSRYTAGRRSDAWLKIRNRLRQEFVVGGWSDGDGSRRGSFGSLLVGHYPAAPATGHRRPRLHYVGRVGSGFRGTELARLRPQLKALARLDCPFQAGSEEEAGDVHWVEPRLVAEVEFAGLTQNGMLRQATFKGLRTDKPARQVVWEQAEVTPWHAQSGVDPSVSVS